MQALSNTSVVVKSSIIIILVFYLLGLISPVYDVFSLSPALLLPPNFRVWTLITGLVVEANIINVIIDIPVVIICGMYLEPLWGAMELLKYMAITGVGTAVLTSFVSLIAYAITHNHTFWFVQFSGLAGVLGGITVAFKQNLPDQKINLRVRSLRVQQIPFFSIIIFILLSVFRLFKYTQIVMNICGITVGWIYLRFFQPHGNNRRGDMNEAFEAATLFPPIIRPFVGIISNILFKIAVRLGLCKYPVRTYDIGGQSSITISLPGSDPADAERRRKKALRALNERLEHLNPTADDEAEDSWPTIEDELNNSRTSTDQTEVSLPQSTDAKVDT